MKALRRIVGVLAGLAVGVGLVELAFRLRDHGAFPHLNVYRADKALGVRLRPGATEKISFSGNPVSQVRINASGYRGADWPSAAKGEIFVVGDSQAFGLGVDEADAFAWRLGHKLSRPVADAAVPTYGPAEYNAVLAEELPRRKPATVVYTINIANDLFEAAHPNPTRHAVWDGWAVRKETAPAAIADFPGRALLFRDSHAFFAARGLWFRRQAGTEEAAVPSEGGWGDLLTAGKTLSDEQAASQRAAAQERLHRDAALGEARAEIKKLDATLGQAITETMQEDEAGPSTLRTARANPGDIVRVYYGEGSAPIPAIAVEIQKAAAIRLRFVDKLKAKHDAQTLAALQQRDKLDDTVAALRAEPIGAVVRERSPLWPHLQRAKQLCDANGAELVVLVLPLDVQVSSEEWKKYGISEHPDLTTTRVLADDVLSMADNLGARAVDAWPALAKAEPGAFLNGDLHMTPKGHEAVATALADALTRPLLPRPKLSALPLGRSAVPTPKEWSEAPAKLGAEYALDTSDLRRFDCTARQVREWLRVQCKGGAWSLLDAGQSEAMVINTDDGATIVAAVLEGHRFSARRWGKRSGVMRIEWALGEPSYGGYFQEASPKGQVPKVRPEETVLCGCEKQLTGAATCVSVYGAAYPGCMTAYAGQCRELLACARGDAASPPTCGSDQHIGGVTHRCARAQLEDLLGP